MPSSKPTLPTSKPKLNLQQTPLERPMFVSSYYCATPCYPEIFHSSMTSGQTCPKRNSSACLCRCYFRCCWSFLGFEPSCYYHLSINLSSSIQILWLGLRIALGWTSTYGLCSTRCLSQPRSPRCTKLICSLIRRPCAVIVDVSQYKRTVSSKRLYLHSMV